MKVIYACLGLSVPVTCFTFGLKKLHSMAMFSDSKFSVNEQPLPNHVESQGLITSAEEMQQHMQHLKSKYPTAEADYLAAARDRNALKMESNNGASTDADWLLAAQLARQQTETADDWESSAAEAGNSESRILIPIEYTSTEGEDENSEEPKLMLF
jgi:hypothetical protein